MDAEVDNGITAVPFQQFFKGCFRNIRVVLADDIDRVAMTPVSGQNGVQLLHDVVREIRYFEIVFQAKVGGNDTPATAKGHDRNPVSARQRQ